VEDVSDEEKDVTDDVKDVSHVVDDVSHVADDVFDDVDDVIYVVEDIRNFVPDMPKPSKSLKNDEIDLFSLKIASYAHRIYPATTNRARNLLRFRLN
jgi:hypothetical protein